MWEYRRRKIEENVIEPMMTEQQLDEYISKHAGAYILDHPIIKGIYIKISDNAHELNDVRQLYTSDKADDIDKLDKLIESAVSYEYFRDTYNILLETGIISPTAFRMTDLTAIRRNTLWLKRTWTIDSTDMSIFSTLPM